MLNRLTFKNRIITCLSFTGITVVLFSIGVFGLLKTPFNWHVLLNYIFVGIGVGLYLYILMAFKFNMAFIIFVVGYIIAFVSLFYMFANSGEGFTDLAGIILWMITIGLVVALGIAIEIILYGKNKTAVMKASNDDNVIDVESIDHNDTHKAD